jgi:integrase/recombinase XerD
MKRVALFSVYVRRRIAVSHLGIILPHIYSSKELARLHSSTLKQLRRYQCKRQAYFPKAKTFFVSSRGTGLAVKTVQIIFYRLAASLKGRGSRSCPRLTDLRHTFSCPVLLKWSRNRHDLDHDLLLLMHYLGHSKIRDTYWYLTGIPDLLRRAAASFENHLLRAPE